MSREICGARAGLGISDRSFAQPALLITARVDDNAGYFDERLATARRELVRLWKTRQASLTPNAAQTDLLGALFVAAERLQHDSGAKPVLVIFSDMRHDTAALTLEPHRLPPTAALLATVKRQRLLADLRGVQVSVLGADAAGRTIGEWQAVRDFWVAYFREAGAVLKNYTVLRDIPESIFASNTK